MGSSGKYHGMGPFFWRVGRAWGSPACVGTSSPYSRAGWYENPSSLCGGEEERRTNTNTNTNTSTDTNATVVFIGGCSLGCVSSDNHGGLEVRGNIALASVHVEAFSRYGLVAAPGLTRLHVVVVSSLSALQGPRKGVRVRHTTLALATLGVAWNRLHGPCEGIDYVFHAPLGGLFACWVALLVVLALSVALAVWRFPGVALAAPVALAGHGAEGRTRDIGRHLRHVSETGDDLLSAQLTVHQVQHGEHDQQSERAFCVQHGVVCSVFTFTSCSHKKDPFVV